ncbi:GntR family transcriptional regulator [Poriferisphaera sp. WC338]|uniref:GntR family transcriptional regulator n=1 Tax=Poriferisphaera sp. WC338 TaxID=3425129 RepID=UPI003D817AF7
MTAAELSLLKVDRASPMPLHAQVERALRQLLQSDSYKDGDLLPNEMDIVKQMGISRGTLRDAIKRLVGEGLLERRAGIGTRICRRRVTTSATAWPSFRREMSDRGMDVIELETRWEHLPAPIAVAQIFQINPSIPIWRLSRLRGIVKRENTPKQARSPKPTVWFRSWFLPDLEDVSSIDLQHGMYAGLQVLKGVTPARSDESISAKAATTTVAKQLRITRGTPILLRERSVYDSAERVIEYAINHYRASQFQYTVSLKLDPSNQMITS